MDLYLIESVKNELTDELLAKASHFKNTYSANIKPA
jgi:hypothetical protein